MCRDKSAEGRQSQRLRQALKSGSGASCLAPLPGYVKGVTHARGINGDTPGFHLDCSAVCLCDAFCYIVFLLAKGMHDDMNETTEVKSTPLDTGTPKRAKIDQRLSKRRWNG
jgi:hypothetical protein